MVGDQDDVGAEELVRVALEALAYAIGEEADARHRGDRDDERRGEDAELARAPVAAQHAPGARHAMRPPTRRTLRLQREASASSCVTSTSVVPCSRLSSNSSSIICAPDAASRLPVGSSAR